MKVNLILFFCGKKETQHNQCNPCDTAIINLTNLTYSTYFLVMKAHKLT